MEWTKPCPKKKKRYVPNINCFVNFNRIKFKLQISFKIRNVNIQPNIENYDIPPIWIEVQHDLCSLKKNHDLCHKV